MRSLGKTKYPHIFQGQRTPCLWYCKVYLGEREAAFPYQSHTMLDCLDSSVLLRLLLVELIETRAICHLWIAINTDKQSIFSSVIAKLDLEQQSGYH